MRLEVIDKKTRILKVNKGEVIRCATCGNDESYMGDFIYYYTYKGMPTITCFPCIQKSRVPIPDYQDQFWRVTKVEHG